MLNRKITKFLLTSILLVLIISLNSKIQAQAVSINTTGASPNSSSILDMSAVSDKGILIPNVALTGTTDATTISSPASGLLVYNTASVADVTPGYYYWTTMWIRLVSTQYSFENGLTLSGSAVKLGGDLSENTTINFGSGFGNTMTFDLKDNSSFIIKNTAASADMVIFSNDGNVNYIGNLSSGEYYNFEGTFGSTGYGFRQHGGDIEYKKDGGSWAPFPDPPPAGGEAFWWYKPAASTYIRPQGNGNIRVYDDGETYGFYYNGSTNQYGGYFVTSSATTPTSALVGFSDVAGSQTKGYLGYNGTYNSGSGLSVDGSAVYGVVDDKNRAAIFGRTSHAANVAAIIGYSSVWVSGFFFSNDIDASANKRPALYGQLTVDVTKAGLQHGVKGWSEYTEGTDNRGVTVGGGFYAQGGTQDARGVNAYASTAGAGTIGYGVYSEVDDADVAYGIYALAGTDGTSSASTGVYAQARTSAGKGVVGLGSDLGWIVSTGNGDGVVAGSDAGAGVFGYFYDGTDANSYGEIGSSATKANYFYHKEFTAGGVGQSTIYAYRTRDAQNNGINYTLTGTNEAIQGYNLYGDKRTFGICGHNDNDYTQTGGVLGGETSGGYWGSLGYKSSGSITYGGYFNNNTTTGPGKSGNNTEGIGIGAYGGFTGAWFRGNIYGTITKGERFAQYIDGKTYTNDIIVKLEDNGSNERIATYVPTSMTADIYMRGTGTLQNGKAKIKFDQKYLNIISDKIPVVVTVTPIGETSGIHLTELKTSGFAVAENNNSRGNIQFTWIAVAVRKDYENPENPKEVLSKDFDSRLDKFMFNENNLNGSAEPMWWDGKKLRYDAIPKTKSTKAKEKAHSVIKEKVILDKKSKNNRVKKSEVNKK